MSTAVRRAVVSRGSNRSNWQIPPPSSPTATRTIGTRRSALDFEAGWKLAIAAEGSRANVRAMAETKAA